MSAQAPDGAYNSKKVVRRLFTCRAVACANPHILLKAAAEKPSIVRNRTADHYAIRSPRNQRRG